MIDLNHDGKIDCKDYVIQNVFKVIEIGAEPTVRRTKDHVFVTYEKDGNLHILDNDVEYIVKGYSQRRPAR